MGFFTGKGLCASGGCWKKYFQMWQDTEFVLNTRSRAAHVTELQVIAQILKRSTATDGAENKKCVRSILCNGMEWNIESEMYLECI